LLKNQLEKTLGIDINNYETVSKSDLVKFINDIGEVDLELEEAMSFEDQTAKNVTLEAGENALNGNSVLALLTDEEVYDGDETKHMEISGDIIVAISKELSKQSLSEFKQFVSDYYDTVDSDISYDDVESYLERIHEVKAKNYNYLLLSGTESGDTFKVDTDSTKEIFDEILSEEGDIDKALSTEATTASGDDSSSSSKSISIEIQNSTSISGLAGSWKEKLTADGYTVGSILTNREGSLTHTKIIIAEDGMGQDLKSYFKNRNMKWRS
jgi:anionic cell wall polymer biosynthesis LytR-Cps2A-Psr (LCP) family protein